MKIKIIILTFAFIICAPVISAASGDSDFDGYSDVYEVGEGSNPFDAASVPPDNDGDFVPDSFDSDDDNDGVIDRSDPFPFDRAEWLDTDGDGTGNNADQDDDNDGYSDSVEISEERNPLNPSSVPDDCDHDFLPDSTDTDDDNDGYLNGSDVFRCNPAEWIDTDSDGTGNNADSDDDADGYPDAVEIANGSNALDADSIPVDCDSDLIPDNTDPNDDNDARPDSDDAFVCNPSEWNDFDGDGIGDNADSDDDNDSYSDAIEQSEGSDPANPSSKPADYDGDLTPDSSDSDDDNDGIADTTDVYPHNAAEWIDTDGDTVGDNKDSDDDNDTVPDEEDAFSLLPDETTDTDADGVGNNADTDDDGDGILDEDDLFLLDKEEWADLDNDGIGDNGDIDSGFEGFENSVESTAVTGDYLIDSSASHYQENGLSVKSSFTYKQLFVDKPHLAVVQIWIYMNPNDSFSIEYFTVDDRPAGKLAVLSANSAQYTSEKQNLYIKDTDFEIEIPEGDWAKIRSVRDMSRGETRLYINDSEVFLKEADLSGQLLGGFAVTSSSPLFVDDISYAIDYDLDNDGADDFSDDDTDNDGYANDEDAFTLDGFEYLDTDGDLIGDNQDPDDDNDFIADKYDTFPKLADEWEDVDQDGSGDNFDIDDDGDGIDDDDDIFSNVAEEAMDTDADGSGDAEDADDDGDGISDSDEMFFGLSIDDTDSDDDGIIDGNEKEPLADTDSDGLINALDPDSDNDGLMDGTEMGLSRIEEHMLKSTAEGSPYLIFDEDPVITTDPLNADTDGGGLIDGKEDLNHNGRADIGETSPINPADDNYPSSLSSQSAGCSLISPFVRGARGG